MANQYEPRRLGVARRGSAWLGLVWQGDDVHKEESNGGDVRTEAKGMPGAASAAVPGLRLDAAADEKDGDARRREVPKLPVCRVRAMGADAAGV
jgi:hypothetical protein